MFARKYISGIKWSTKQAHRNQINTKRQPATTHQFHRYRVKLQNSEHTSNTFRSSQQRTKRGKNRTKSNTIVLVPVKRQILATKNRRSRNDRPPCPNTHTNATSVPTSFLWSRIQAQTIWSSFQRNRAERQGIERNPESWQNHNQLIWLESHFQYKPEFKKKRGGGGGVFPCRH